MEKYRDSPFESSVENDLEADGWDLLFLRKKPCPSYFCKKKNAKMSQITLELNSRDDLEFLLDLAKRLNLNVVSVRPSANIKAEKAPPSAVDLMKTAAEDPLFLADIEAVAADFKHADLENV